MTENIFRELEKAILDYDKQAAARLGQTVVRERLDISRALETMTSAVRQIGEGFGRGEMWLPDLVGASETMSAALPFIEEELKRVGQTRKSLGKVIIGTVFGDLHTIGKTMVGTMLVAEGFAVRDIGINVKSEEFVAAVRKDKPDILAMSALMTMTAPEQRKTIELLKKEGLREKTKVIIGGGAISQAFADEIGADGYDPTAPGAAKLARRVLGI